MRKLLKSLVTVMLAVIIAFSSSIAIFAATDQEIKDSAGIIEALLKLINDKYVGSSVDNEKLTDAAIKAIMDSLDLYSDVYSASEFEKFVNNINGTYLGIGVGLKVSGDFVTINTVVEGSSAQKAGILPGDQFYKIGDTIVTNYTITQIQKLLESYDKDQFMVTMIRKSAIKSFTVKRTEMKNNTIYTFDLNKLVKHNKDLSSIGYAAVSTFGDTTSNELKKVLEDFKEQGKKHLILDFRNNPGGYVNAAVHMCEQLVPKGPIIYTKEKNKSAIEYFSVLEKIPFEKIYVLINENTASSAEIVVSALQDSGVGVLIGKTTFGKGIIQTLYTLGEDRIIKLTTEEYFRRSGAQLNQIGVKPDIECEEKSDDIDDVLMKTIEEIFK